MILPIPYHLKRFLRALDCAVAQKTCEVRFRDRTYRFFSTYWWPDATQEIFDTEIVPYFDALQDFRPSTILDVGAASGHFSIVASDLFSASLHAFEPAQRQRILLRRNASLNRIPPLKIEPFGLWNRSDEIAFRTNGDESSFAPVSRFQGVLEFPEKIPVMSLDEWAGRNAPASIDLIKMDAEGAEIEILEGAGGTLARFHPRLLVQAYHLRGRQRTFERCAAILTKAGYTIQECPTGSGLLYAS